MTTRAYNEYLQFFEELGHHLAGSFGQRKTKRLLAALEQTQFEAIRADAVSGNPLKREWFTKLSGGYSRELERISASLAGCLSDQFDQQESETRSSDGAAA